MTVTAPGSYTAQYHPESWLGQNPAYAPAQATVRWHPLGSTQGWFAFLIEVGWRAIPFLLTFYAGKQLLTIFGVRNQD
ncbi:hypothetical protein ACFQH6_04660 [Halobacteriaceae archaeon GCM10025711]